MATSPVATLNVSDFSAIVGAEHVRDAVEGDAIDGVQPRLIVEPGDTKEAAAVLACANRAGLAVAPRGEGTKMGWGNPPDRMDLILSMRRMDRVLEHAPGDLVVRTQAGVTLSALRDVVSAARQMLALDPPEGGTIGGLIATNASGPLRLRYGAMRDLLIGVTYILPDGAIAKAGGKVVKNVAGYDIGKLLTGSLGTLAVISEAILRLHPIPPARRLVTVTVDKPVELRDAVQSLLHSTLVPSAMEFSWEQEGSLTVQFEGIEPGVEAQTRVALELLSPHGEAQLKGDSEMVSAPPFQSGMPEDVEVKINALPTDLAEVIESTLSCARQGDVTPHFRGHAGSGISFVNMTGDSDALAVCIRDLRQRIMQLGGTLVIRQASPDLKQAVEVWGPAGDALSVMRRLKERFDPRSTLNPGRFLRGVP